jgi:hypothetical protein
MEQLGMVVWGWRTRKERAIEEIPCNTLGRKIFLSSLLARHMYKFNYPNSCFPIDASKNSALKAKFFLKPFGIVNLQGFGGRYMDALKKAKTLRGRRCCFERWVFGFFVGFLLQELFFF